MKAILFDLDGVLYQGTQVISGARETLDWVQEKQIPHRFLTNTTSRPRCAIVQKLHKMGIDISTQDLLTPPLAAVGWLQSTNTSPVALFVPEATRDEFSELEILPDEADKAAAVVVGDMGDGWSYATLNRAFRLLMQGHPKLLALGMTRYWQASDGLRLDAGAMVSALSYASGIEPLVFGKPAAGFFQAALDSLNV